MVGKEIFDKIGNVGVDSFCSEIRNGFSIDADKLINLLSSVCSGHHLLLLGPTGCGKTTLALRIAGMLEEIEVVRDCPLHCSPDVPVCPWCMGENGKHSTSVLSGSERLVRVQGSDGLVPEDLIGDLDPEVALAEGIHSLNAFVPGKLFRANRGILLIDFIDRIPERVSNTILSAMQEGVVSIGAWEEAISVDTLIMATGSKSTLDVLPSELLDCFDIITFDYSLSFEDEQKIVMGGLSEVQDNALPDGTINKALEICRKTRNHVNVKSGVSTRGAMRYAQFLSSWKTTEHGDNANLLPSGSDVCLPHRIQLTQGTDLVTSKATIIRSIINETLGLAKVEANGVSLSLDDMMSFVEEVARDDKLRKPLKYGALDLLLARLNRFPDSQFNQLMQKAKKRMESLYPERFGGDNLTDDILMEVEEERKRAKRKINAQRDLEMAGLKEVLGTLEKEHILDSKGGGWELGKRSVAFLLDELQPKTPGVIHSYGYGRHSTGRKTASGEGKVVGIRKYRFGDRYRDISFKETLKNAIRNQRRQIKREDIMVEVKDVRSRWDILLVVDLSGTMHQLHKLWYAKESMIGLAMAASIFGDRVGVISFSNLSDMVADVITTPYNLTKRIIDLEIHENAFTNIGAGILKAIEVFSRHGRGRACQHIILISDGHATAPHPSPQRYALQQAAKAIRRGVTISCVCIAHESTDPDLLRRIARIGRGSTYVVGLENMSETMADDLMMIQK